MSDPKRKTIPDAIRIQVLTEAGYRCACPTCPTIIAIDIHHIVEVHEGGGNDVANLLALCPTCHALYHRGTIDKAAIVHWKKYVQNLSRLAADDYLPKEIGGEMQKNIGLLQSETEKLQGGLEIYFKEYSQRFCQIGFIPDHNKRLFIPLGCGTYIRKSTVLTTASVVLSIQHIMEKSPGIPHIMTRLGPVRYEVKTQYIWGSHCVLHADELDLAELQEEQDDVVSKHLLLTSLPDETEVRFRWPAFLGEELGFFHSPLDSRRSRFAGEPQLETARISFQLRTNPLSSSNFVTSPVLCRVSQAGSGVFSKDGYLVGVIKEWIEFPDDIGSRAVVANFNGVRELGGAFDIDHT